MKAQRTLYRDPSPTQVAYVVTGACATFLCLLVWLLFGWQLALLLYLGGTAHAFWQLVGSTPEVQDLVADLWHRWGTVRHA